jgi:hypothetical protein
MNQKSCCEMSFGCFIHGVTPILFLGILIWFFSPPAEINLSSNLGDFSFAIFGYFGYLSLGPLYTRSRGPKINFGANFFEHFWVAN